MPITDFQRAVLRLLASNRAPDSYVAGATVINRSDSSRVSQLMWTYLTIQMFLFKLARG